MACSLSARGSLVGDDTARDEDLLVAVAVLELVAHSSRDDARAFFAPLARRALGRLTSELAHESIRQSNDLRNERDQHGTSQQQQQQSEDDAQQREPERQPFRRSAARATARRR